LLPCPCHSFIRVLVVCHPTLTFRTF